jgi:hypothetical protein
MYMESSNSTYKCPQWPPLLIYLSISLHALRYKLKFRYDLLLFPEATMVSSRTVLLLLFYLCSTILPTSSTKVQSCTPQKGVVDLGYAKHIPTYTNTTASGKNITIYKNIRFANPPTGNLRFRRPDTNLPKVRDVQDGHVPWRSTNCISSAPAYIPFPDINGTTWGHEDCLFLDVYVPEGVKLGDKVPVLHLFHGSAFAFGSKDWLFSPMGLFDMMDSGTKFIFVANNYR